MAKKTNSQEIKLVVEAIEYFKAAKERAPRANPLILELLDKDERTLQDQLFELMKPTAINTRINTG